MTIILISNWTASLKSLLSFLFQFRIIVVHPDSIQSYNISFLLKIRMILINFLPFRFCWINFVLPDLILQTSFSYVTLPVKYVQSFVWDAYGNLNQNWIFNDNIMWLNFKYDLCKKSILNFNKIPESRKTNPIILL